VVAVAKQRVLPTLNPDGTRRRLRPTSSKGRFYRARRSVAYGLMLLFVAVPWIQIGDKPLLLLDVAHRKFSFFGRTFLPTDGALLMLLLLAIFVGIVWLTALFGRAWCGFGCPQTVYLEFLFRPIERWFERRDGQKKPLRRAMKLFVFAALSVFLANVFLSYFVPPRTLLGWLTQSPFEHFTPFLVVAVTSALVFADFAYFREQMCTVACPYARLQSALLDGDSLVVGYDARRGEPRGRGKTREGLGDCIDCGACVATCPTGIDIRDGLQLECIACAQCVDACDRIMARVGKPPGLLRYASPGWFEARKPWKFARPRTLGYLGILLALTVALVTLGAGAARPQVTLLRGTGAPFERQGDLIVNQIRLKIENRGSNEAKYQLSLEGAPDVRLIAPINPLPVPGGEHRVTTLFALAAPSRFSEGELDVRLRVRDQESFDMTLPCRLLGPRSNEGAPK
jgi:cytochrome c oxidase accessory protein FixG